MIFIRHKINKSRFKINYPPIQPYYAEPEILLLGAEEFLLGEGKMFVYGKERLICDCLKFEEKLDREVLQKILFQYIRDSQKDIQKLMEYAKIRRVTQKVQNRIGVWL